MLDRVDGLRRVRFRTQPLIVQRRARPAVGGEASSTREPSNENKAEMDGNPPAALAIAGRLHRPVTSPGSLGKA